MVISIKSTLFYWPLSGSDSAVYIFVKYKILFVVALREREREGEKPVREFGTFEITESPTNNTQRVDCLTRCNRVYYDIRRSSRSFFVLFQVFTVSFFN